MKKELDLQEPQQQALNIPVVINRLFDLQRFDIDSQLTGKFVKWEDVRKLITEIRISNSL